MEHINTDKFKECLYSFIYRLPLISTIVAYSSIIFESDHNLRYITSVTYIFENLRI